MRISHAAILALATLFAACGGEEPAPDTSADAATPEAVAPPTAEQAATIYGRGTDQLPPEEVLRGRNDPSWQRVVQLASAPADTSKDPETWKDISPAAVNNTATHLPLHDQVEGPSVLKAQILLDRAYFSPGIVDGYWGKNAAKAVYWFQSREGLPATGQLDRQTFERLVTAAGSPQKLVVAHTLTEDDVAGPFVSIPDDVYEKAELDCLCYSSLSEKLAEMFHTSPDLLAQLNPGVELDSLRAGEEIQVPGVRDDGAAPEGKVAQIVISDEGFYLHALDAQGRILYHFPTTLGSEYAPSPEGEFHITSITPDPKWHYQPALLTGVPDDEKDAMLPAGPNNAVGVVWMALSKPHYGIHGTSAPETIGYTTSHGCVRLTNWDARFLSKHVSEGTPVHFRDVDNPGEGTA